MKFHSFKIAAIWFAFSFVFVLYKEDIYGIFPKYYFSVYPPLYVFKQLDWILISSILLYYLICNNLSKYKNLKELNNSLFNNNPLPMWQYQADNLNIVAVNKAACIKYGFEKEEFLKMTIIDLRPTSEQARLLSALENLNKDFQVEKGLWEHRKKNGESFFVVMNSFQMPTKQKDIRLVMALDIEDKMVAERKVENLFREILGREAYLKSLIDSQTSFLVRIKTNGTYSYFNPQFNKVLKVPVEALQTLSFDELVDYESEKVYRDTLRLSRTTPQTIHQASLILNIQGKKLYTQWEFIGLVDNLTGIVKEIQLTGFDITNRVIAEQNLLKANEGLQERNTILSEIAYLQSHKIRGPLARIVGLLNLKEKEEINNEVFFKHLRECTTELDLMIEDVVGKANEFEKQMQS